MQDSPHASVGGQTVVEARLWTAVTFEAEMVVVCVLQSIELGLAGTLMA
jgi:hypothetical protein